MTTYTKTRPVHPMFVGAPYSASAMPGHELVDLNELAIFRKLIGADQGYHTQADAVITQTRDGFDINTLWAEFQATLEIFNARRTTLVELLTFNVVDPIERVPQVGSVDFEDASEFGVPKAVRVKQSYFSMGYDFRDYDIGLRYTWKFIRDHDARQVQAEHNAVLEGYNRLVFRRVMEAIFDNRNRIADIEDQNINVYALYNADGTVPPAYKGSTFDGTHTHYTISNGTADGGGKVHLDSDDLDGLKLKVAEHGYGDEQQTTFVAIMNEVDANDVRTFRAGQTNFNGAVAKYDFIPSAASPTIITPNQTGLIGSTPPSTWNGLTVIGSYNNILIIAENYIPVNYVLLFGTGGTGGLQNLVGIRQHANTNYRGLRLIPGNQQGYPLVESFYSVGFGTGVRQRAGGAVLQLKASGSYDIPAAFMRGGGNG